MSICRAGFKKQKVIRHFLVLASQLRIILAKWFATANHYSQIIRISYLLHIICLKRGKFCLKKGKYQKNKVFWLIHLKSDSQCQKNLANHFAKVIFNYPKSDYHLAMQYRPISSPVCICMFCVMSWVSIMFYVHVGYMSMRISVYTIYVYIFNVYMCAYMYICVYIYLFKTKNPAVLYIKNLPVHLVYYLARPFYFLILIAICSFCSKLTFPAAYQYLFKFIYKLMM